MVALISKVAVALRVTRASQSTRVKDPQRLKFSVWTMKLQCVGSVNRQALSASFISLHSLVAIDSMKKERIDYFQL